MDNKYYRILPTMDYIIYKLTIIHIFKLEMRIVKDYHNFQFHSNGKLTSLNPIPLHLIILFLKKDLIHLIIYKDN